MNILSLATAPLESASSPATWEMVRAKFDRIWNFTFFSIDNAPVTVGKLVIAVFILAVGTVIAKRVSRHLGHRVLPRLRVERGPAVAIQSIVFYILLAIIIMFSLQMAEVPLTVFTIFGGALALGIGIGSQNLVNNFISGLVLLLERPVSVGQLVEVDGHLGVVEKVGARATRLAGYQGASFIVPNSLILESPLTNWHHDDDRVRTIVAVGVAYGSPTDAVRSLLLDACAADERVMEEPPPTILFREFGDNALAFEMHFWIRPQSALERMIIESDLRYAVDALFREHDICIAFPQRDVHLDSARPVEVKLIGDGHG
jgi:small-conductance mechanosensitive channel